MKFDQHDEVDEPIRPKSIVPPMRKASTAVRFRIFTLVAMLCLVIYAMIEAGKPERWEWLGFEKAEPSVVKESADRPNSKSPSSSVDSSTNETPPIQLKSNSANDQKTSLESDTKLGAATSIDSFSPNLGSLMIPTEDEKAYPKVAVDFWRSLIDKMNPEQEKLFLEVLHSMRHHKELDEQQKESASVLIDVIGKRRDRFHQDIFDQIAIAAEGSEAKKNLSDQLILSRDLWDKKIFPALKDTANGEDITLSQLQAVHRLQKAIDPVMMSHVRDRTALGWKGDTETWKRIWENVVGVSAGAIEPEFEPVTRIQLMSQPHIFRGKPVKIEGWVRGAKRVAVSEDSALGIPEYFELWIRPKESKLGPHCVFVKDLPEKFPVLTNQLVEMNEQVEIDAYFFKVRTYVAEDKVRNAPTLMAASLTTIAPVDFTSANHWQPSRLTLTICLVLIPIVATMIAIWVYNYSKTKPYEPGKMTSNQINKTLHLLTADPDVQTDQQKIMALYDSDKPATESKPSNE